MYLIYLYIYVKYIIKRDFCIVDLNRTACFAYSTIWESRHS